MVSLLSLWLPILLGAVLVFIVSSIIHVVLKYHENDFAGVPNEEQVAAVLRPLAIPPGEYMIPKPATPKDRNTPQYQGKLTQGPVLAMTVWPNETFKMGRSLAEWFAYCVVVGVFVAYVASRTVPPGTEYLQVFRVTGTVAFMAYGLGLPQASIWFRRRWSTTLKSLFDALIYGLMTAGAFGWLWP